MLVRVKEPLTEIRLEGAGCHQIVADLMKLYPDQVEIDEDEDFVPIERTEWYQQRASLMTPGKRLRIYRDNARLTLTALAERCDIPKTNLSQMEHDKRPIGKITAKKLAEALSCDYRSLL